MNAPISPPAGSPPDFPNLYVIWSVFNILILIAIVVLVFWYFKKHV